MPRSRLHSAFSLVAATPESKFIAITQVNGTLLSVQNNEYECFSSFKLSG